jgi:pSer/pThr/pTyr-binding forkhead associated (FHA) protein
MQKRTPSSDQTQISAPKKNADRIPERYQASLVIVGGHSTGMEYTLTAAYSVIGRDKEADVMLKDPLVSRQHAVVIYHNGNYVLKDLDSTNGTHLKGANVKQADLRHGDTFRVGETTLQFVLDDAPRSRTYEIG